MFHADAYSFSVVITVYPAHDSTMRTAGIGPNITDLCVGKIILGFPVYNLSNTNSPGNITTGISVGYLFMSDPMGASCFRYQPPRISLRAVIPNKTIA